MAVPTASSIALPGPIALTPAPDRHSGEQVRELAHEFESMLLLQMLRQMRQSMTMFGNESDGALPGLGNETLTDTMDAELARQLSVAGGLGIADLIVNAFARREGAVVAGHDSNGASPALPSLPSRGPEAQVTDSAIGDVDAAPAIDPMSAAPAHAVGQPTARVDSHDAAVPLPLDAPLSSPFGWRADPLGRGRRFHGGIDVKAAYGRPVPSAAAGRVVFAGEQGGYGTTVVVEHGPGLQTRYAHLSASLVREGQSVAVGETLGRVGSTGRSTGPHLHFEVIEDGRRIDPIRAAAQYARLSMDADSHGLTPVRDGLKEPDGSADSPNGGAPRARAAEE